MMGAPVVGKVCSYKRWIIAPVDADVVDGRFVGRCKRRDGRVHIGIAVERASIFLYKIEGSLLLWIREKCACRFGLCEVGVIHRKEGEFIVYIQKNERYIIPDFILGSIRGEGHAIGEEVGESSHADVPITKDTDETV